MSELETWHALMSKVADGVRQYLVAQAQAGAQALQLFDSWAGQLAPDDYRRFVMPYSQRVIEIARQARVPLIHFGTDTGGMLESVRDAGGDVIGVDWRMDLDAVWSRLGYGVAVQGNLDPAALFAPWEALEARARSVLDQADGRTRNIFNLGQGVLPGTPREKVERLVDFVHDPPAARRASRPAR